MTHPCVNAAWSPEDRRRGDNWLNYFRIADQAPNIVLGLMAGFAMFLLYDCSSFATELLNRENRVLRFQHLSTLAASRQV